MPNAEPAVGILAVPDVAEVGVDFSRVKKNVCGGGKAASDRRLSFGDQQAILRLDGTIASFDDAAEGVRLRVAAGIAPRDARRQRRSRSP